jgi:hypothetical protein
VNRPATIVPLVAQAPAPLREYVERLERAAGDDFRVDRIGASHSTDPGTSQQAAKLNFPRSGNQRRRVLEALVARGSNGATFEELVVDTGIESAAKRLTELVQGGWVFQTESTRPTHTGSPATVHLVTEKALVEIQREWRATQTAGGGVSSPSRDDETVRDQTPPRREVAAPSAVHQPAGEGRGVPARQGDDSGRLPGLSPADPEPVSLFGDEPQQRPSTSPYDVEAA